MPFTATVVVDVGGGGGGGSTFMGVAALCQRFDDLLCRFFLHLLVVAAVAHVSMFIGR